MPDALQIRLDAQAAIRALSQQIPAQVQSIVDRVLEETAKAIYEDSRAECPVDTGFLRDSAYMIDRGPAGARYWAVGYDAFYAWQVHENPKAGQRLGVGTWKWLETAFAYHTARLPIALAEALRRGLRGGR